MKESGEREKSKGERMGERGGKGSERNRDKGEE